MRDSNLSREEEIRINALHEAVTLAHGRPTPSPVEIVLNTAELLIKWIETGERDG